MDLNLYLGLPPLPRPPGRLGAAMDSPAPAEDPRTDDQPAAGSPAPEELPPPPVVYWAGLPMESPAPAEGPRTPDGQPAAASPPPPEVYWPGPAMDSPAPAEAPRTPDDLLAEGLPAPEEVLPPQVVDWMSNPLSEPIDPMLVDWLDGTGTDSEDTLDAGEPAVDSDAASDGGLSMGSEDTLDAGEPAAAFGAPSSHDVYVQLLDLVNPVQEAPTTDDESAGLLAEEELLPSVDDASMWGESASWSMFDSVAMEPVELYAPSDDANVSPPPPLPPALPLAGLEGVRLEWVERLSRPGRAAPAATAEMVSTTQSTGGAIEDTAPELRLQRVIQVSEQHRIVQPGPANRNQRATSPEAERLAQAIQQSHGSLDASRRQNLNGDGRMGGTGDVNKDGSCGCNSGFDCNICLDAAKEPVVTPCGHLFCWPCLYQWLHGHSAHSECPVCKGEVLEVNVTPIYGRGGGERDASTIDVPPRPSANRSESLRQELQVADPRGLASMIRRLIENQDQRSQAAPPVGGVEVAVLPEGGRATRIVRRRASPSLASPSPVARQPSPLMRLVRRSAPESGNHVQLTSSNSDNATPAVPQQSSSVEQASTSSTVAVIVGEAAQSRRSRPASESTPATTRRTRRRQQH